MSADGTTPEELEADLARQRDELAATVTALQSKLDVKARAQDKVGDLKERATTADGKPRPDLAVAVVAIALVAGLLVWRRRH